MLFVTVFPIMQKTSTRKWDFGSSDRRSFPRRNCLYFCNLASFSPPAYPQLPVCPVAVHSPRQKEALWKRYRCLPPYLVGVTELSCHFFPIAQYWLQSGKKKTSQKKPTHPRSHCRTGRGKQKDFIYIKKNLRHCSVFIVKEFVHWSWLWVAQVEIGAVVRNSSEHQPDRNQGRGAEGGGGGGEIHRKHHLCAILTPKTKQSRRTKPSKPCVSHVFLPAEKTPMTEQRNPPKVWAKLLRFWELSCCGIPGHLWCWGSI